MLYYSTDLPYIWLNWDLFLENKNLKMYNLCVKCLWRKRRLGVPRIVDFREKYPTAKKQTKNNR